MKLVFAGTPEFAAIILAGLLASPHQVAALYTQPDRAAGRGRKLRASPTKVLAESHHIPVMQPLNLRDAPAQQALSALQADAMIVAAYGLILPPAILAIPRLGCINIHASLLPRWRGAAPIQRAIEAGDEHSGVCIMQMEKGLDTGPVLAHESCDITAQDTAGSLHDRLAKMGSELLVTTLARLEQGAVQSVPQNDELTTYAHRFDKSDAHIHWSRDAATVERQIRAYNPAPGAWTEINREPTLRLRILRSEVFDEACSTGTTNKDFGRVIQAQDDQLLIACGRGTLALQQIQIAGKRAVSAREFNNAKTLNTGDQLV